MKRKILYILTLVAIVAISMMPVTAMAHEGHEAYLPTWGTVDADSDGQADFITETYTKPMKVYRGGELVCTEVTIIVYWTIGDQKYAGTKIIENNDAPKVVVDSFQWMPGIQTQFVGWINALRDWFFQHRTK